jgi:transposase
MTEKFKYYSSQFKYEVLMAYKSDNYSLREIRSKYGVTKATLYMWNEKFEKYGFEGLKDLSKGKLYSKELKEAAVRDYLSGEYSLHEVIRKYDISTTSTLRKWIKKYNSHRELKDSGKGRTASMTKGRKTTWEERIEIAIHCLENGKNYQETGEKYKVSYQQVYQWTRKYETKGPDALKDNRGRKRSEAELSPEEKNKLEMKRLEIENERLRAENAYLKKLEEIERRQK